MTLFVVVVRNQKMLIQRIGLVCARHYQFHCSFVDHLINNNNNGNVNNNNNNENDSSMFFFLFFLDSIEWKKNKFGREEPANERTSTITTKMKTQSSGICHASIRHLAIHHRTTKSFHFFFFRCLTIAFQMYNLPRLSKWKFRPFRFIRTTQMAF